MLNRISKNEERLDNILNNVNEFEIALSKLKSSKKDLDLLNKYYESKLWLKDKEDYETGKIPKIKAGVLSEDAVWNVNEHITELLKEMKDIIHIFQKNS